MSAAKSSASSRVCAVVPAAGRGTRLGAGLPKVFVPILPSFTIWDAIRERLAPLVERIVLVLSPEGRHFVDRHSDEFSKDAFAQTELAVQEQPRGMGDAIFGAATAWSGYDDLLIVWGDQFNLAEKTLAACLELHRRSRQPALTLPVVRAPHPYVEYAFAPTGELTAVRQSREGDACTPNGFSDIGVFLLSGGEALRAQWELYLKGDAARGSATKEINFLPFLVHLSQRAGWGINRYETDDASEAVGINTPEELLFARRIMQARRAGTELP